MHRKVARKRKVSEMEQVTPGQPPCVPSILRQHGCFLPSRRPRSCTARRPNGRNRWKRSNDGSSSARPRCALPSSPVCPFVSRDLTMAQSPPGAPAGEGRSGAQNEGAGAASSGTARHETEARRWVAESGIGASRGRVVASAYGLCIRSGRRRLRGSRKGYV